MIYYACSYVPLEILIATKQPFKKIKTPMKTESELIHRNLCDYCKTIFQTVMNMDKNDVFVSIDSCDAMRRISDVLKKESKAKIITLRLPWKNDSEAVSIYKKELKTLIKELTENSDNELTENDLFYGISFFKKISDNIWDVHMGSFPALEKQKTLDYAFDGQSYTPENKENNEDPNKPGLAIIGGFFQPDRLIEIVNEAGGRVVLNESCQGIRPFTGKYSNEGDNLFNIAQRIIQKRLPCGRFYGNYGNDLNYLLNKFNIDGVIKVQPKFCDFYGFTTEEIDLPVLIVESEFPQTSSGQLLTRIGAFIEKIRKKKPGHSSCFSEEKLFAGIDSGSTTTNIVIIDKNKNILYKETTPTGTNAKQTARSLLEKGMKSLKASNDSLAYTIATGYGRNIIDFASDTVTEITCHARGAKTLFPEIRSIIDIGGQDSKSIKLGNDGSVKDFAMNDKCAAGTGRFLEVMSNVLEINLNEMSTKALNAKRAAPISSMCTVFAESEVVSLLGKGENISQIAAGLANSIAKRVAGLYRGIKGEEPVAFTGGVARNNSVKEALEKELNVTLSVPEDPDIVGAFGAALFARQMEKEK
ncbi:MAG: acyl-CoA dehydratase activase [Thermotogota bacterium]|nr:acyl-CoA dehydratase activase [Thermotogota bacterium]